MVDNLELFAATARNDLARLRRVIQRLRPGRGYELGTFVGFTLERVEEELQRIDNFRQDIIDADPEPVARERLLALAARRYERLQPPLDVLYETLGMYEKSVNRTDVPVGLQHLIDVLMAQLVRAPSDPMIHLDPVDMYSTVDLVSHVDYLFERRTDVGGGIRMVYTGVHPIVFNLPALDPANALLSPLIAHEVTHTAVDETLLEQLSTLVGASVDDVLARWLAVAAARSEPANETEWASVFRGWCEELICDAVAIVLTGPSFLFAFSAYLPPTSVAGIGTHPHLRDRVQFHLDLLDTLGWTSTLDSRSPELMEWFRGVGASAPRAGSALEGFLLEAIGLVRQRIVEVSIDHVEASIAPDVVDGLEPAIAFLREGIPAVDAGAKVLDTWELILAGWFAALEERADKVELALLMALDDPDYSALLIKALEMSSIVTKWRRFERAGT